MVAQWPTLCRIKSAKGLPKCISALLEGGPEATDFYYRRLISTFAGKNATLELTIVPTLLNNLARNDAVAQTAIYTHFRGMLI